MLLDLFYLDRPIWSGDFTTFNITMPLAQGTYALDGQIVGAFSGQVLVAATGLFVLTGQSATFDVKIPLAQGDYVLTGEAATFDVKVPLAQGAYALAGQPATFDVKIPLVQGSYALVGKDATFGVKVPLDQGSYVLTGQSVILTPSEAGPAPTLRATMRRRWHRSWAQ